MIRGISKSRAPPLLNLKQVDKISNSGGKEMYVQYPYKFNDKYYAKIDGKMIEISREVALVMLSTYRNELYRSRKWAPEDMDRPDEYTRTGRKKWRRKTKWVELLECVLRESSDYDGIQDFADEDQESLEEYVVRMEIARKLHECIQDLNEREQMIVEYIYFEQLQYQEVADRLKITKGRVSQIVSNILDKLKKKMIIKGVCGVEK